jgi:hypothetical protein
MRLRSAIGCICRCANACALAIGSASVLYAQPAVLTGEALPEGCAVSVLNRVVRTQSDGKWVLPNVPAGFGQVRARATCVIDGETVSGESDFFVVPPNGVVNVPPIKLGSLNAVPVALTIAPGTATIDRKGATAQLAVSASFRAGTTRDVTGRASGIAYTTSNPAIATVSADGVVTGVSSGTVIIQASLEGKYAMARVRVVLAVDTDGDGMPDDVELREGLNPNDPNDALEDADRDGLSNRDEVENGTNLRSPDTDRDSILDGEEVVAGADGFITNPQLADSDGDGVRDALEILLGTDPGSAASVNVGAAISGITVRPSSVIIVVNAISSETSRQLSVIGTMLDGTTLDLTSTRRGTAYTSTDLTVCNFGAQDGLVFGGSDGSCTISVRNGNATASVPVTVSSFAPTALSQLDVPGGLDVEVAGDTAYVAAGSRGLHVVDVADRRIPRILTTLPLPGVAQDVRVVGAYAYVAGGPAGLHVVDVSIRERPALVATLPASGDAQDVAVAGGYAYVALGAAGLLVADVRTPSVPRLGRILSTAPRATLGVDVDGIRGVAALAQLDALTLIDVRDPVSPVVRGVLTGGQVWDVAVRGQYAYLADTARSFTVVDIANLDGPVLAASTSPDLGGLLYDVTVAGIYAVGADAFFVNGVPVIDISTPSSPAPRARIDFAGGATGISVAADAAYFYMVGSNGVLYVGQYLAIVDDAGLPPSVTVSSPAAGSTVIARATAPVSVAASDDVAVAAVEVLLDGQVVGRRTSPPYEFAVRVPKDVATVDVSARATDFGGNSSTSSPTALAVIVGPVGKVSGRVLTAAGLPVAGAVASIVGDFTATSGADGRFEIPSVPLALGVLRVLAQAGAGAELVRGFSATTLVRSGQTVDVGDIPVSSDADGDGLPDSLEQTSACLRPLEADADLDPDRDGIVSLDEFLLGTNPCAGDTDRDGLSDGRERDETRTDPLRADTDGDGWLDGAELDAPSDPLNSASNPLTLPQGELHVTSALVAILNQAGTGGMITEVVSALVSVANTVGTNSGPQEVTSALVSVQNATPPPTDPFEVSSAAVSVFNQAAPVLVPNELTSALVSVSNTSATPGVPMEVSSAVVAVWNGTEPPFTWRDAVSPLVFVKNLASAPPAQQSTARNGEDAKDSGVTVALAAVDAASTLVLGETTEFVASVSGVAEAVELVVNGQVVQTDTVAPYAFTVTWPQVLEPGVARDVAVEARVRTTSYDVASGPMVFTLIEPTPTRMTGRLVDTAGQPIANAEVAIETFGYAAEYFDLSAPVLTLPTFRSLQSGPRDLVSGLSFRNPLWLFGRDPWRTGMTPAYGARYSASVEAPSKGTYDIVVGASEGARVLVDGALVLTVPSADGQYVEHAERIELTPGIHDVVVEAVQSVAGGDLRVEMAGTGGGVPLRARVSAGSGDIARTDSDGRFAITAPPSSLRRVRVQARPGGVTGTFVVSEFVNVPRSGGAVDVGSVVVR